MAIIGIAKRLEEIFTPNDELPLYIDKKSPALILVQHMRNEAHRFGITHHRKKRTQKELKLSVSDIKGIGDKTIEKILKHFKSFENARKNPDELEFLIGKSLAVKFLEG
jgi:excinuclease ABC subunit C